MFVSFSNYKLLIKTNWAKYIGIYFFILEGVEETATLNIPMFLLKSVHHILLESYRIFLKSFMT